MRGDFGMGARAGLGCRRRTEEGFGFADEWIGGTYIVGNMSLCGIVEVRKATDNNPIMISGERHSERDECGLSGQSCGRVHDSWATDYDFTTREILMCIIMRHKSAQWQCFMAAYIRIQISFPTQ